MTHFFPMFIDLNGRTVLLIGGGRIALRRAATLAAFGAVIRVAAEWIAPELEEIASETIRQRLSVEDVAQLISGEDRLVLAATDDPVLNRAVARLCQERGIAVNVCDSPQDCDFFFPAVAMDENIAVGITSSGQDHHQVARVAKQIRAILRDDKEERSE